jgi:hypothetical protein
METITIQPVPSQLIKVVLGGQNCQIAIYSKPQGLFFDLNSNGSNVVLGVIAHDANPLISARYLGFIGNLIFVDTQGSSNPTYDGLGTRYTLTYLNAAENVLI